MFKSHSSCKVQRSSRRMKTYQVRYRIWRNNCSVFGKMLLPLNPCSEAQLPVDGELWVGGVFGACLTGWRHHIGSPHLVPQLDDSTRADSPLNSGNFGNKWNLGILNAGIPTQSHAHAETNARCVLFNFKHVFNLPINFSNHPKFKISSKCIRWY